MKLESYKLLIQIQYNVYAVEKVKLLFGQNNIYQKPTPAKKILTCIFWRSGSVKARLFRRSNVSDIMVKAIGKQYYIFLYV